MRRYEGPCANCGFDIEGAKGDYWHIENDEMHCWDGQSLAEPPEDAQADAADRFVERRDRRREEWYAEIIKDMTPELDAIQRRLLEDDRFRRLLFAATGNICSGDLRCRSCERHAKALELLWQRRMELHAQDTEENP